MFKEFIKFISDDPIMLGLSCAIIFLVVVFILVLIFGGKKKEKEIEEKALDNTKSLLKSDLTDEPLHSTREYNVSELTDTSTKEAPIVDAIEEVKAEEEAPISVSEAIDIKNEREEEAKKDTIEIPVVNETKEKVEFEHEVIIPEVKSEEVGTQPFSSVFVEEKTEEKVEDDIELPKLNTKSDTSVLNKLEVEEYKL